MNIFNKVILFTVENSDVAETNIAANNNLGQCLDELGVKYNTGINQQNKVVFVTIPKDDLEADIIKDFAFLSFKVPCVYEQCANGLLWETSKPFDYVSNVIGKLRAVDVPSNKFIKLNNAFYSLTK